MSEQERQALTVQRALVIRHHLEDHPGLIGEAFRRRGIEVQLVTLNAQSSTPSLEGCDFVVILGSKCAVYDEEVHETWFGRELELLREADRRGIPILGICFGAQALCQLFGGTVSRAPEGEVGWFDVELVSDVALPEGPWFEFHFDRCDLPEAAQVWATSSLAVQAFSIGQHVGVQFHPEIDADQLRGWLESDPGEMRQLGLAVDELIRRTHEEEPAARERAQILVDLFLSRL